jgi:RHS repeat-associated protein
VNIIETTAYDNLDNPTSVTDPAVTAAAPGNVRTSGFDALNRVIARTNPLSQSVSLAYDGADNLSTLTDPRALSTSREVDGFGEIIQEISPDRGTRSYWYDADGDLTKLVDGDGVEQDYAYDGRGRRTSISFPSDTAENTTFSYDATSGGNAGVGRLTGVTEASGSTSFTYDAQGRLTADAKVISPSGYTGALSVGYAYDVNGKVVRVTYPSGDVAAYTRTTDGLITAITFTPVGGAAQTILAGATYEPFGPLASFTYGNGLTLSRGYDQDYRLTGINVAAPGGATRIALSFGWQADGRLAGWSDAVGDRSVASATPSATLMTVSATSNQVTGTTLGGAPQRSRTYAAGGDLLTDAYVGGISYAYSYNAAKRLIGVTQNGAAAGAYAYDFQGQRVWRQTFGTGGTQTAYVYDKDGHLIAEHNAATGTVSREYVWLDDMPVALADISAGVATIGYIHTGQIDEPLEVTNQTQAVAWNAAADPFGAATVAPGATTALDMRLPGQSFQLEAGSLSQNHWRDYDPSLGRYAEADPLGIDAGANVYGYVDGDPVNWMDPWGLAKHDPNSQRCLDLAEKITKIQQDLLDRYNAIDSNQRNLPERIGPGESLASTVRGHRTLINIRDRDLRNAQNKYDDECGPPSPPPPCPDNAAAAARAASAAARALQAARAAVAADEAGAGVLEALEAILALIF